MHPIKAKYPFEVVGPLPIITSDNKYMIVIVDYFTKWAEAFPLSDQEAVTESRVVVEQFILRFGALCTIMIKV